MVSSLLFTVLCFVYIEGEQHIKREKELLFFVATLGLLDIQDDLMVISGTSDNDD